MTKAQKAEREEMIAELRAELKPGQEILCILRHCSRSGMQRVIDLKYIERGEIRSLGFRAALAMNDRYDRQREGIVAGGCGMDMGFALVYNLAATLWRDGFMCTGNDCPSNDHPNGMARPPKCTACDITRSNSDCGSCLAHENLYYLHASGGYALRHRWI